eukprot:Nitzschia sp. Nitz4//scaffold11_size288233//200855//202792//NITZ4_000798-RA/size288233-processed-gene-0.238-mRNA-1//-1//CDS//3329534146//5814//frame0
MALTYESVIHKKAPGRLTLTPESLNFSINNVDKELAPIPWTLVAKHQVSPVTYPKPLLKLVLKDGKSLTYQMASREHLEKIRTEISQFLLQSGAAAGTAAPNVPITPASKKRPHAATQVSFEPMDPTALAVTRSSLLAANPTLRAQHQYLVLETNTVTEEDFWTTHHDLLEEEYARIRGMTRPGSSSLLQSHLQLLSGRVTLGVEEMRQIFILYPAVHKAYEEKVPLELSDEQFWRKYLESEYFHRDRGRLGAASRQSKDVAAAAKGKTSKLSLEDQEARAAAVGTDDLFSRYDQKLKDAQARADSGKRVRGTKLGVGQFDLASTFETERGELLEGPKDNHPSNDGDSKGTKVIQKYNRHWAMVLHPEEAVAGSDLMQVARKSVNDVLPGDEDAKAQGGVDEEMFRLVSFAEASSDDANHALGIGVAETDQYEQLTLHNLEGYHFGQQHDKPEANSEEVRKRNVMFATALMRKVAALATSTREAHAQHATSNSTPPLSDAFPPVELGKELLLALTKKMAADSKTDEDALAIVNSLPEDFKKKLHLYFRRTSELLRHFFGLRKLEESSRGSDSSAYKQKQQKIVTGMETVYREMDGMRKELEDSGETGGLMRTMYLQIMDQLDWAFKKHREGTGSGGGGFVTTEEF